MMSTLPGGDVVEDFFRLLFRPEAADHVDRHRKSGKPVAQRFQVLECQHGRRREKRDLLAVHHRLEGGAHRHLGLAVADVAAQQAIHRRRRLPCLA